MIGGGYRGAPNIEILDFAISKTKFTDADVAQLFGTVAKTVSMARKDAFSVSDELRKDISKGAFAEALKLSESYRRVADYRLDPTESLSVAPGAQSLRELDLAWEKRLASAFAISDGFGRTATFKRAFAEALSIADCYVDYIDFMIRASESLTFGESLSREIDKGAFQESFRVADSLTRQFGLNPSEQVKFAEIYDRTVSFYVKLAESLRVADDLAKHFHVNELEPLTITDQLARNVNTRLAESIAMIETFGRTVSFKLALAEGLSVRDALKKAITLPAREAMQFFEEYRRHANAVISDLLIDSGDVTLADFQRLLEKGAPPGYTEFRPFLPGDYDYQDALFKVVMKGEGLDRPELLELAMEVDVPDVFDRGAINVPAGGTATVVFNRRFYVPPEIVLQMKGGTVVATPKIVGDVRIDGFDVALVDANGNYVSGRVSWSAHGY